MANLDNYHPFRASVNVKSGTVGGSASAAVVDASPENAGADKEEKDFRPWISWKTKLLLLVLGLGGSFLLYIGLSIYQYLFPLLEPFGEHHVKAKRSKESAPIVQEVFDKNDLDTRGRDVSAARHKAGFFASIFCKGGKKSTFCD